MIGGGLREDYLDIGNLERRQAAPGGLSGGGNGAGLLLSRQR
jgi:hypothetical protein